MKDHLKHPEHMMRYFVIFGIIAFVGYTRRLHEEVFLALIGPALYVAHAFRNFIDSNIAPLPAGKFFNYYAFLLPVTLIYYGFIGYQFKKLWNETGPLRLVILVIFLGFIGYIHILAYGNLLLYLHTSSSI